MKHASLVVAAVVVLLANGFALTHAARNRGGQADAEITLTDRELVYYRDKDDSGVNLTLRWVDPGYSIYSFDATDQHLDTVVLANRSKLEQLGFDCTVNPEDRNAREVYSRQAARVAF